MKLRKRRHDLATISGYVEKPEAAESAIEVLTASGIPRDLVEVAVSPSADDKFYAGRARRLGTLALPYAGVGGLIGLLVSVILSLEILVLPGLDVPERLARVQLLGPNYGAIGGALVGALIGALRRRRPKGVYARACEREAILVMVHDRPRAEADVIAQLMNELGVQDVRIDVEEEVPTAAPETAPQT